MCQLSKITSDWITKGCHIHVDNVEVVVRPNHLRGIVIKKVFQSTSNRDAEAAGKRVLNWLGERANRQKLFSELERAQKFMLGQSGVLESLARGRGAEFAFLKAALKRLGI
ncbi:MAG: hypothetical protein HY040_18420 [Planctomycetes bacterium]|nr:hypothetical protein [Planctomycetota bacterium]